MYVMFLSEKTKTNNNFILMLFFFCLWLRMSLSQGETTSWLSWSKAPLINFIREHINPIVLSSLEQLDTVTPFAHL